MALSEKLLDVAKDINKHYKRAVVMPASEYPVTRRLEIGVPITDYSMGGGFPLGFAVEFFGPESSTKTFNAQKAIAAFQRYDWENHEPNGITVVSHKEVKNVVKEKDGTETKLVMYEPNKITSIHKNPRMRLCALIDVENTYDPTWGEYLGIDNKLLLRIVPPSSEAAVDIAETLLSDPEIGLVVFDSVHAARPAADTEKSMEDQTMGSAPRFWNRASAKMTLAMNRNPEKANLILINRSYDKVGLVFGNPEKVYGGRGLAHLKAVSIRFEGMKTVSGEIDGGTVTMGRTIKVENKKNKTGRPFKSGSFFFLMSDDPETGLHYGETDDANDLTELGLVKKVIELKGKKYTFGRLSVVGRDAFVGALRSNPRILRALLTRLYEV